MKKVSSENWVTRFNEEELPLAAFSETINQDKPF